MPWPIHSAAKPHCGTTLRVVNRDAERRATILQNKQAESTNRPNGRRVRDFNPASREDTALFAAAMRGEHFRQGFHNEQIRAARYGSLPKDAVILKVLAEV